MNSKGKRLITVLLPVLLAIICFAVRPALSEDLSVLEEGFWGNLIWELDESGELTIKGSGDLKDMALDDRTAWKPDRQRILRVVINDGVTSIGDCAFSDCANLNEIVIPESVVSIGDRSFWGCASLTDISIPDGVQDIGAAAFDGCYRMRKIVIPDGVTVIEKGTFEDCWELTEITIPGNLKEIQKNAFRRCEKLKNVHYSGTEKQKETIEIQQGNECVETSAWEYAE